VGGGSLSENADPPELEAEKIVINVIETVYFSPRDGISHLKAISEFIGG